MKPFILQLFRLEMGLLLATILEEKMKHIELLAPAGDLDKLKFAIEYGADAVYIGGEIFGLKTQR